MPINWIISIPFTGDTAEILWKLSTGACSSIDLVKTSEDEQLGECFFYELDLFLTFQYMWVQIPAQSLC